MFTRLPPEPIALKSTTWLPPPDAFVEIMRPQLVSVTLAGDLFIWIRSASWARISAVLLVALPLTMTRFCTPVLSRITRPVPVCTMLPRLLSVALLPLTVTATVEPPTVRVPVAHSAPVWPLPLPSVCADVNAPQRSKDAASAAPACRSRAASARPLSRNAGARWKAEAARQNGRWTMAQCVSCEKFTRC